MLFASVLFCLLSGMNSPESFTFRLWRCQCQRLPSLQCCVFKKPEWGLHLCPFPCTTFKFQATFSTASTNWGIFPVAAKGH